MEEASAYLVVLENSAVGGSHTAAGKGVAERTGARRAGPEILACTLESQDAWEEVVVAEGEFQR